MILEEKKLLTDIYEAIVSIDEHLNFKRDFTFYLENKTVRRAVEREFEIIGEAMSKLLKINTNLKISFSRTIVDLRNRVIHSYDTVDDIIIWKTITKDLPLLKEEVENLLQQ
jgi:uncharacterized protein with HEPN domain